MIDVITDILGVYSPLSGSGLASVNWAWIAGAVLFTLVVWFVFKLILRLIEGTSRRR